MKLTDAMNTYNPALEKISKMGYTIGIVENEEDFDWEARKGNEAFIASDPLRLLGLIALKNEFNTSVFDYYDSILKKHFGE